MTCGKNLFEQAASKAVSPYGVLTFRDNGYICTSTVESTSQRIQITIPSSHFRAGHTYTISFDADFKPNEFAVGEADDAVETSSYNKFGRERTFTVTEITKPFLCFLIYKWNATVGSSFSVLNIQIEEGYTATAYEPYTGTDYPLPTLEPLMSLPNGVCDEYDAVTGMETRRIGKRILNGTETYRITAQTNTDRISVIHSDKKLTNGRCSHFVSGLIADEKPGTVDMRASDATTFFVVEKDAYTVEGWKAYLTAQHAAGTPVTVYYELATPVVTQHDPTAIPAIYPKTTVYADKGNVAVSYNRDSNKVINTLTNAIIALGGTLDV